MGETMTVGMMDREGKDFKILWILDEHWSGEGAKWTQGQVTVDSKLTNDQEYKIIVQATKGQNNQSYIAFDEVLFLTEKFECNLEPPAAQPTEAPPTTSPAPPTDPPTTIPPTEPPGRKSKFVF